MERRSSLHEKVWSKVEKGEEDECWPWKGGTCTAKRGSPYGKVSLMVQSRPKRKYRIVKPHRFIFEEEHGTVPKGKEVCHSCGNSLCCNPAHLYAGTHRENIADMVGHGTSTKGETNPKSKLREEDVQEILRLRQKGKTLKEIAEQFPVSLSMVGLICQGKAWA